MKRAVHGFALLSLVVALLLAGCGGPSNPPSSSPTPAPTPTSSTTTASVMLKHVPNGMATLNWDSSNHTLTAKITLSGLAPSSTHPSHIHTGSCANQGAVVHPLQNIVADATGNATVISTIPNVTNGIPASGWYVNVHNGPGLSPADQFLPIVCGDVSNSNTSTSAAQSVQVALNAAPAASVGQAAMGTAQLSLSGSILTVKLMLSHLAPNSIHAAHIHQGSCSNQGPVVYPLQNVVADGSGNATVTTTLNKVSSIPSGLWYINVHRSIDLSTQTGFDPIACGDVTLS